MTEKIMGKYKTTKSSKASQENAVEFIFTFNDIYLSFINPIYPTLKRPAEVLATSRLP